MTAPDGPSPAMRLTAVVVVVAALFAALFARLWYLQVIDAPKAQQAATNNGVRVIYIPAPRGEILDRNGNVLVGNVNEPVIEVSQQIAAGDPAMVARLAPLLGMTVPELTKAINNLQYSPYAPVPVLPDASPEQILYIQEHQDLFPGVQATTESVRTYSKMGRAAANIVGYVGRISQSEYQSLKSRGYQQGDEIGQAGVEETFESVLRGTPGIEKVQVDSQGNVLATLSYTPPVPGDNLRLSIDGRVQMVAEQALEQGMASARQTFDKVTNRNFDAPAGSAVVEDPTNGQILALASVPTYNPAQFIGGISEKHYAAYRDNPAHPLLDRTLQGDYASGSTFKLVTATAGLESGLITPNSLFHDTGVIMVGNTPAHNDNYAAYGWIDLPKAITVSSDNFFNTIGIKLWYGRSSYGEDYLQNVAEKYGFGHRTGIALPGESPGFVPTPQTYIEFHRKYPKDYPQTQWYAGNSDQLAIGQDELLVTPLQLANAYAAFANGGSLMRPQIAVDAETATRKVLHSYGPQVIRTIPLKSSWRDAMLQGFEGVIDNPSGTAYGVFAGTPLANAGLAGKTGTAQLQPPHQDTSVFTSFGPVSNPHYVVDAFVEEAGYGASVAAPVTREIWDALLGKALEPVSYSPAGSGGQN